MFESVLTRVLRAVFGDGSDISAANPLQVYDPAVFNSLVVYEGTATADGPDTSTITDTVLATKPDFNGQLVVITSGDYKGQTRDIDQATNIAGGQVHVAAAFGGIIVSGATFVILSIRPTTVEATSIGKLQVATATIELNQAAGAKDLFTGTTQDVVVEKLMIRIPVDVPGGAMASLSIQTDDTTAQIFIDATTGAKANLTAQAQLAWTGAILLKATKKIQLTIAGAATGIACSCDVVVEYRAVVAGGYLA